MASHSGILAWRIPGTEEPGELQSMGSHPRSQAQQQQGPRGAKLCVGKNLRGQVFPILGVGETSTTPAQKGSLGVRKGADARL